MERFFGRFRRRLGGETALLRTHRAEFQDRDHAVGALVDHDGVIYVVTRWVELPSVPLSRGGSVREWEVFGRPADPDAVERAVEQAAERILDQAPPPGDPDR